MLGLEESSLKLGIIGIGAVGSATAMAAASRARVREIVLLDRERPRAKAVATDMHYGVALQPLVSIRDGDYADLADAGLAIITAGVNEKAGGATDRNDPAGRLRLLNANVKVFQDIVPKLVKAPPQAVILVATDPPEPRVDVARQLAGHDRVMGTSTYLDSLRFRLHVGERLGAGPGVVEANVVGEHGTSSVFLWSSARVGGMPVRDLLDRHKIEFDGFHKAVEQDVRFANITIIEGIGASQYGIGVVSARIAEVILRNERAVFPAGSYNPRFGTTVSLPSIVGRQGVIEVLEPAMSDEERQGLELSAQRLKDAVRKHLSANQGVDACHVRRPPGFRSPLRPCRLDPGPAGPCGHQTPEGDAPADPGRHGFIGPHQVRYALARGHLVTVLRSSAEGVAGPGRGAARRPQRRPQSA